MTLSNSHKINFSCPPKIYFCPPSHAILAPGVSERLKLKSIKSSTNWVNYCFALRLFRGWLCNSKSIHRRRILPDNVQWYRYCHGRIVAYQKLQTPSWLGVYRNWTTSVFLHKTAGAPGPGTRVHADPLSTQTIRIRKPILGQEYCPSFRRIRLKTKNKRSSSKFEGILSPNSVKDRKKKQKRKGLHRNLTPSSAGLWDLSVLRANFSSNHPDAHSPWRALKSGCGWWYYPTPSEGWGRGGTLRRPNSRATSQGLDHRSRIEREEPKIDLRRGSEAGQSRRRWLRSYRGCPQALQAEFSFRLILWRYEDKRRLWPWQRRRESS